MSLNTLLSINGLSQSSIIFPGQSLTVGQSDGRTVSAGYTPSKTTATSTSTSGTYTVQAGDTLYSIARRSGMSLNTLLSINGLSQSSVIRPGQTLSVSGNASQATATQVSYHSAGASTSNGTYTVKAGDTLYRIAYNHGISLTTLLSKAPYPNILEPEAVAMPAVPRELSSIAIAIMARTSSPLSFSHSSNLAPLRRRLS